MRELQGGNPYEIIIIDGDMPDMGGLSLVDSITKKSSKLPVIIYCTEKTEDLEKAEIEYFNRVIAPIDKKEISFFNEIEAVLNEITKSKIEIPRSRLSKECYE